MALATVLETATQLHFDKKLQSQIAFSSPEWFKIYENANTRQSGRDFVWNPRYARRSLTWMGRYGSRTIVPTEHYTQAKLLLTRCIASAMLDDGDVSVNTPPERVVEMLAEELAALKDDTTYGMAVKMWTGVGGLEPVGLYGTSASAATYGPLYLSAPTSYAGIAEGTYSWWAPNRKSANSAEVSLSLMKELSLSCTHDADKPDLWVTSADMFRKVYGLAVTAHRIVTPATDAGKRLANLGFDTLEIDGLPMVWSENCPQGASTATKGNIFCLNTKDIEMRFVPGYKMKRTEWTKLESQPTTIACDMMNHFVGPILRTPRNHGILYLCKEN